MSKQTPLRYFLIFILSLSHLWADSSPSLEQLINTIQNSPNPAVLPKAKHETWAETNKKENNILQKTKPDVLLIGDSITHGWKKYPKLTKEVFGNRKVLNLGHPADKTQHMIWRLLNYNMTNIQPEIVVLLAGTNNSGEGDGLTGEKIAEGVETIIKLLEAKFPDTSIVVTGIFPRGSQEQRRGLRNGNNEATINPQWEKINRVNDIIKTFAESKKVRYLNFNDDFLNSNGAVTTDIMYDLLHLTEQGYEIWAKALKSFLSISEKAHSTTIE